MINISDLEVLKVTIKQPFVLVAVRHVQTGLIGLGAAKHSTNDMTKTEKYLNALVKSSPRLYLLYQKLEQLNPKCPEYATKFHEYSLEVGEIIRSIPQMERFLEKWQWNPEYGKDLAMRRAIQDLEEQLEAEILQ